MAEGPRPSYRELAEALKDVPTREMVQDQRLWDWWTKHRDTIARIPDHIG